MQLSPEEYDRFSTLYNGLLTFADQKLALEVPQEPHAPKEPGEPDFGLLVAVRDALFQQRGLIDAFVAENPGRLGPEDLKIVADWKQARVGDFYVVRHLKRYTVFMGSTECHEPSEELFGVLALDVPFTEIVTTPLPALVRTVLLPFQERIIFDGILSFYKIDFGSSLRRLLDDCYKAAKAGSGIRTALAADAKAVARRESPSPKQSEKPEKPTKPEKPAKRECRRIQRRLEEVLEMIPCPIGGCWSLHGAETAYWYDSDCRCHTLEVWPVGFEEPVARDGNGRPPSGDTVCYDLAEFEFRELVKEISLEHFHFSQQRAIFEIGWKEFGHDVELRVHIEPWDPEED